MDTNDSATDNNNDNSHETKHNHNDDKQHMIMTTTLLLLTITSNTMLVNQLHNITYRYITQCHVTQLLAAMTFLRRHGSQVK